MSEAAVATKVLSIGEIAKIDDIKFESIEIPEWGGAIRIASIDAGDMIEFAESTEGPAKRTAGLRLIVKSLVDESGKRIGKDEDLQMLKKKNSAVTNRIVEAILTLNGLKVKDQDTAKNG